MKYRYLATVILGVMVFALAGSTLADSKAKKASFNQLVALLPASDGVLTFDVDRFFGEALPKVLSTDQATLARITAKIDDFQAKTGIDIRQFDEVAVGVSARKIAVKKYDIDPVVIGRGQVTSASLIGAAKVASNGKYREERVGGRVMYIFDAAQVATQTATTHKVLGRVTHVAVTALDDRTLAFGDVERVRQTLERKTRVGADLIGMLERSPAGSVAAFAANPPEGLKAFLPLENDELGRNIDSIEYIYGHTNLVADSATIHVTARTQQNAQAVSLHETLAGLQMIGKAFLGGAKGADKQVYARLVENAKISVQANEVVLDLTVPQSDISILVGLLGR